MNVIKQYGLERTGTNYIKALIDLNTQDCRVLSNLFGLKHEKFVDIDYENYHHKKDKELNFGEYTDITEPELEGVKESFRNNDVKYVVNIKDPYSWVISYNACHWIPKKHGFDNGPLNLQKVKRYLDRWNSVNKNWLDTLDSDKTYFTTYTDLIINPEKTIREICDKFGIQMNDTFKDIEKNMGMMPDVHGSKNFMKNNFNKRNYYINRDYMGELSNEIKDYINNNMDNTILEKIKN